MKSYKSKVTLGLILSAFCFGSFPTYFGFRITTNLTEEVDYNYVPSDTFIADTVRTFYSGVGADFHISLFNNFDIRTNIAELRFLFSGGNELLIFPGVGADLSYSFPIPIRKFRKFSPYLTFGLNYHRRRLLPFYQLRGGFGLGYTANKKFNLYLEIPVLEYTTKSEKIGQGAIVTVGTGLVGIARIHLGTKLRL